MRRLIDDNRSLNMNITCDRHFVAFFRGVYPHQGVKLTVAVKAIVDQPPAHCAYQRSRKGSFLNSTRNQSTSADRHGPTFPRADIYWMTRFTWGMSHQIIADTHFKSPPLFSCS